MAEELLEFVVEIVEEIAFEIGIAEIVDPVNMRVFTQTTCRELRARKPDKNVMIVHGGFNFALVGPVHAHYELPLIPIFGVDRSKGYEIYTLDSGTFNFTSDGGYENWCFDGSYTLDPNNSKAITFYKPALPPSPPPPPPPPQVYTDGVYLVNSVKGDQKSSGFAYYSKIGNNEGTQPQAYVDILTGGCVTWEGNAFSGAFKDGTTFFVIADLEAQSVGQNGACGTAHITSQSNTRNMTVYKDDFHVIYTVDGWAVHAVYYCK